MRKICKQPGTYSVCIFKDAVEFVLSARYGDLDDVKEMLAAGSVGVLYHNRTAAEDSIRPTDHTCPFERQCQTVASPTCYKPLQQTLATGMELGVET